MAAKLVRKCVPGSLHRLVSGPTARALVGAAHGHAARPSAISAGDFPFHPREQAERGQMESARYALVRKRSQEREEPSLKGSITTGASIQGIGPGLLRRKDCE